MSAVCRRMTLADVPQVHAIEERTFATPWSYQSFVDEMTTNKCARYLVAEEDGQIVATAKINQEQVPVYASAAWSREAKPQEVMVLHTLVVDPQVKGKGWGSRFVAFYEDYAKDHGCRDLRMDTNERNAAARRLYHNLGYQEVSILPCEFNGIPGVNLVCLEKLL